MQAPTLFLVALTVLTAACSSTRGSPSDAGVTADSGLPQVPYWQWYYPACGAPGTCDSSGCAPVQLTVGPVGVCGGPTKMVTTGCLPSHFVQDNYAFATSDHQLIITNDPPYTRQALTTCIDDGMVPDNGHCCTWLDGGGPTTAMLFGGL